MAAKMTKFLGGNEPANLKDATATVVDPLFTKFYLGGGPNFANLGIKNWDKCRFIPGMPFKETRRIHSVLIADKLYFSLP